MSIRIDQKSCVGCGSCVEVCPGNLIKMDQNGKAVIRRERDCWGCTSCLKECRMGAVCFFLGADIGGRGSTLSYEQKGDYRLWTVTSVDGKKQRIAVNAKESNQY